MDESGKTSREEALAKLAELNASHQSLSYMVLKIIDNIFQDDGTPREIAGMSALVNVAFAQVQKAKQDLDSSGKMISEIVKAIELTKSASDSISSTQGGSKAQINSQSSTLLSSPSNESVNALKKKYETSLQAASSAGAPKKMPPPRAVGKTGSGMPPVSAKPTASVPNSNHPNTTLAKPDMTSPVSPRQIPHTPAGPESIHSDNTESTSSPPTPRLETPQQSDPNKSSNEPSPRTGTDKPVSKQLPVPGAPVSSTSTGSIGTSEDMSETTAAKNIKSKSGEAETTVNEATKEKYKQALQGLILPGRKPKASGTPQSPPSRPASPAVSALDDDSGLAAPIVETHVPTRKSKATLRGPQAVSESSIEDPINNSSNSHHRSDKRDGNSTSNSTSRMDDDSIDDQNQGTKSEEDLSSSEEEYLRELEARRVKYAAEKDERVAKAKEAREARLNMYSFLNAEPPPGFIKSTPPPNAAGRSRKNKEKRKGSSTGESTGNSKSGDSKDDQISTPRNKSSSSRNISDSKDGADSKDKSSKSKLQKRDSFPTDGRDSPSPGSAATKMETRHRAKELLDDSIWKSAEETIRTSTPTKKRWEGLQGKYQAKEESTDSGGSPSRKHSSPVHPQPVKQKSVKKMPKKIVIPAITSSSGLDHSSSGSPVSTPRGRPSNADSEDGDTPITSRRAGARPCVLEEVDDPRVFYFEAPETDSNLRVALRGSGEETVLGGTIEKLIQRLTSHSDPSTEFFASFMMTYHNFLTPQELIELLQLRWNSQPSDPSKKEVFVQNQLLPIRLRILNVVKMWTESFGSDFKDESVKNALLAMLDKIHSQFPPMIDAIRQKLLKASEGNLTRIAEMDEAPPEPYEISGNKQNDFTILDIHPEEFARQLTLVEHALFKDIPYKELLTKGGSGKINGNPSVAKMIACTNHIVAWIATTIVTTEDLRLRAITLARFITIAKYCIFNFQNYNAAMEILSALRSSSVFRLKQTWNMLPDNIWDDYDWLEDLFESDDNFAKYRAAIAGSVPPCVPYLGRYLSDILFLNEIHPDYLTTEPPALINFAKMTLVCEILQNLQSLQKNPYCLIGVSKIQKFFLLKKHVQSEKDLYKLSLEREPRES